MGGLNGFFNIGFSELMFILIIAGLFLGPHRIRDVARWLGKMAAQTRQITRQFTQQLEAELDESEVAELRGAMSDIRSLQKEVADLRREVLKGPAALISESNTAATKIKKDINSLQQELDDLDKTISDETQMIDLSDEIAMEIDSLQQELDDLDKTISEETQTIGLPNVVEVEDDPAI